MRKLNHLKKIDACIYLIGLKKKHVKETDIKSAADKFDLAYDITERAWRNFTETGGRVVDRNDLYHIGGKNAFRPKPSHKGNSKTRQNVTFAEAKAIISEYMSTKITSRELSVKYDISVQQFYNWLHELEVKGTLLGNKILDTQKYAKVSVVDAIWLKKVPNSKRYSIRKLSYTEKEALSRVGDILEIYLK